MRKIAVIGANSFSGQDLVDLLLDDPENRVLGISRSEERSEVFLKYRRRKGPLPYEYHKLDLNGDAERIARLLDEERPGFIVNFAAQGEVAPSWDRPEHWFETNAVALARLVNHLRKRDYLERYLHVSSPEVYGTCEGNVCEGAPLNPSTPYAASKAAADMILAVYRKQFGFPVTWVRATNVYGAGQQLFKIIPRSVIFLKSGKTIRLHGGGRAVKSYIHVRDVSRGERTILFKGPPGEIYHLSPAGGISVRELVMKICSLAGRDFASSIEDVEERPGQDRAYVIDSGKARRELGWGDEIPLEAGLREVIDWVDRYWEEIRKMPLEYVHKA